ncbi:MAG: class I SAM-dependent methyltransferase [Candidatus Izemoplasmatales bacterium]
MIKITDLAHKLILEKEDIKISVDMTVGKGFDTVFLSEVSDFVYGFDIQKEAIDFTNKIIEEKQIKNVRLINDNHKNISDYITKGIDLAIYNLGYLPGSSKEIKTESSTTLFSLQKLLSLLNPGGLVIIVLYPHNLDEINSVREYCSSLPIDFDSLEIKVLNRTNSPFIIHIKKR